MSNSYTNLDAANLAANRAAFLAGSTNSVSKLVPESILRAFANPEVAALLNSLSHPSPVSSRSSSPVSTRAS